MLVAGFVLDYFETKGLVLVGFTILFSVALATLVLILLVLLKIF